MLEIIRNSSHFDGPLPVCASQSYLSAWSEDYGWFVGDRFVLPFFAARQGALRHLVLTADTIWQGAAPSIEEERLFLNAVVSKAQELRADFISQPRTTCVFRTVPDGAIYIEWGTYRVDLNPGEEALFQGLHRHHRRAVRKAIRDGVEVKHGPECLQDCYDLIRETLERQRKPCLPLNRFVAFRDNLGAGAHFYVATIDGVPHASALLISDIASSYYLVGGSPPGRHAGASTLLHWTAMLDMKASGVSVYDFVGGRRHPVSGSKQEGLQVFKARFGTRFHQGYLWKYPLRRWRYRLHAGQGRLLDALCGNRFHEDMIDNEIRTAHLPRSGLRFWRS